MTRSRTLFVALPIILVLLSSTIWALLRDREPASAPAAAPDAASPDRALPDPDFHLYLLMGQSNMVGGGEPVAQKRGPDPRVRSMNPQNEWEPGRDPLYPPHGGVTFGVGPGMPFARAMIEAGEGGRIGLVPCAEIMSRLAQWERGLPLYEKAVERARIAMRDGVLEGVLWQQGESESGSRTDPREVASYAARLERMIRDLREELGIEDLPVVMGEMGSDLTARTTYFPNARVVNDAILDMPRRLEAVAVVSTDGLARESDGVHFTAEGARELGRRYAEAMVRLQQNR